MPSGDDLLGNYSAESAVRRNGLWNIAHLGALHSCAVLERMEEYVQSL